LNIVITGSPGVGKHTIGKAFASRLTSSYILDINELVISNNLVLDSSGDSDSGLEVDVNSLSCVINKLLINSNAEYNIIIGHLAPYVIDSNPNYVFVLRRSPYELIKVYQNRGYSLKKIKENLSSEVLGVIFCDSVQQFGNKVIEIDSTKLSPDELVDLLILSIKNQSDVTQSVDWLPLINSNGDLWRFFDY
jgi:adenylate kinase